MPCLLFFLNKPIGIIHSTESTLKLLSISKSLFQINTGEETDILMNMCIYNVKLDWLYSFLFYEVGFKTLPFVDFWF
jgi:hypothetical protein